MVGLVLVSHSRALVESLVALVRQVGTSNMPIAWAAGIGDDHLEFGTDTLEIKAAILAVYSPDGVLVLMDLGSAILSTEMALDLLDEDLRAHIRLCPAPLVEGAISAAIEARLGSNLNTVYAEALAALHPKEEHLAPMPPINKVPTAVSPGMNRVTITVKLTNLHGLHVRPAARFVQTVGAYDADVLVQRKGSDGSPVSGKSLNKLATLGAVRGDEITISATGPQAVEVINALHKLVTSGFGEGGSSIDTTQSMPEAQPSTISNRLRAMPASEGIVVGPLRWMRPLAAAHYPYPSHPSRSTQESSSDECHRLNQAIRQVEAAIAHRIETITEIGDERTGEIFKAQQFILNDDALVGQAHDAIVKQNQRAEQAWQEAIVMMAGAYRALADPYLRQRASDVEDVGVQVMAALAGNVITAKERRQPAIVAATDFTPTQVAGFDSADVLGLVMLDGSATSHAAILARALGIPMVADARHLVSEALADGVTIALDGGNGEVWVDPQLETLQALSQRRAAWVEHRLKLHEESLALTTTRDGHRVEVAANLSGLVDAKQAVSNGAEAVGVLRTEFLYLTRETAPMEEEQVATLRQIAGMMGQRPVIVRTLDVGGDKSIPYFSMPVEANPFLGVRAIRLSLQQPDLFSTQIRAILRAGVGNHLRILLPMITVIEEATQARQIIEQAHETLDAEGIGHTWPIQVGIMVETPAAALLAAAFAPLVDFYSIGTNDLTQYTLAAERGNPNLGYLSDALHPAVLRLIDEVTRAAHQYGKWAGICGEVAADPVAIPILVGLGIDELSMSVNAIPQAKAIVRQLDFDVARILAQKALNAASAQEVRALEL